MTRRNITRRDVPAELWQRLTAGGKLAAVAARRTRKAGELVGASFAFRLTFVVPLAVVSAANTREHWAAKHRRVRAERVAVRCELQNVPATPYFDRVTVTLTRLGGRTWDDDNNVSGLKATRDEVANWLHYDDGSDRMTFVYRQEPGGPRGVRIEIESVPPVAPLRTGATNAPPNGQNLDRTAKRRRRDSDAKERGSAQSDA